MHRKGGFAESDGVFSKVDGCEWKTVTLENGANGRCILGDPIAFAQMVEDALEKVELTSVTRSGMWLIYCVSEEQKEPVKGVISGISVEIEAPCHKHHKPGAVEERRKRMVNGQKKGSLYVIDI